MWNVKCWLVKQPSNIVNKWRKQGFNLGNWTLQPVLLSSIAYCLFNGNHIKILLWMYKDSICLGFPPTPWRWVLQTSPPSESLDFSLGAVGLCGVVENLMFTTRNVPWVLLLDDGLLTKDLDIIWLFLKWSSLCTAGR